MTVGAMISLGVGVVTLGIAIHWGLRVMRLRARLEEAQAESALANETNDTELMRLAVQKVTDRQMRLSRLWPWGQVREE